MSFLLIDDQYLRREQKYFHMVLMGVSAFKESDGIFVLGLFFFSQANIDFLTANFDGIL